MTRLLVTGKSGQLVSALIERAVAHGVTVVPVGRPELDLARSGSLVDVFAAQAPDAIVSAAAYTAVDRAESEPDTAFAINGAGAGRVAEAAALLDVPIIHISTDYVFDGSNPNPYVEEDEPRPISVYGASKLAGEISVRNAQPNHVILRTAWVYSPFGNNFVKTILKLAGERPQLRVVSDQVGNPTSALDIADAVIRVAGNLIAGQEDALRGVFHLSATGEASWADFAEHILDIAALHGVAPPSLLRIGTNEYPTPARRPANSRLATDKLRVHHGVELPLWRHSTEEVVTRLMQG